MTTADDNIANSNTTARVVLQRRRRLRSTTASTGDPLMMSGVEMRGDHPHRQQSPQPPHQPLFRYHGSTVATPRNNNSNKNNFNSGNLVRDGLLERHDCTPQQIVDFCQGIAIKIPNRRRRQGQHQPQVNDESHDLQVDPQSIEEEDQSIQPDPENDLIEYYHVQFQQYRQRHEELWQLTRRLRSGRAHVEEDTGRLLAGPPPAATEAPPDPRLVPPPRPDRRANAGIEHNPVAQRVAIDRGPHRMRPGVINNDHIMPLPPPLPIRAPPLGVALDPEERDRLWWQEQEREAAQAIARALERYQRQQPQPGMRDVDWNDLTLLTVTNPNNNNNINNNNMQPPAMNPARAAAAGGNRGGLLPRVARGAAAAPVAANPRNNNNNNNTLTLRRILIAVSAVVATITCMMVQALPLFQQHHHASHDIYYPSASSTGAMLEWWDRALYRQLFTKVHSVISFSEACPQLQRRPPLSSPYILGYWRRGWLGDLKRRLLPWFRPTRYRAGWNYTFTSAASHDASTTIDCSHGVVHIPSQHVLIQQFVKSKSLEELNLLEPFVTRGVQTQWFIPCQARPADRSISPCYPGSASYGRTRATNETKTTQCAANNIKNINSENKTTGTISNRCFRGVHDEIVDNREVLEAHRLGAHLISLGGDHFDIRYDTTILTMRLGSVVDKLRMLLRNTYHVVDNIQPVAFRIHAAGPMDGHKVSLYDAHSPYSLGNLLNRANYLQWMERCLSRNEMALFSPLPWPFATEPIRDTCHLMADLQANHSFAIQTNVFLSNGAALRDWDYQGGATLFVDDHQDDDLFRYYAHSQYNDHDDNNGPSSIVHRMWGLWRRLFFLINNNMNKNNPRYKSKIQRGITIDGTRGRVVVSTGGWENRHCRLPIRAGIRATLQIWWSCQ